MNNRQILYQADVQKTAKHLKFGAVFLMTVGLICIAACLTMKSFSDKLILISFIGVFVTGILLHFIQISKWSGTKGKYQIYLDSIGIHAHSDEPALGQPFSVAASNLHHLVRKHVRNGENIEYEYYVEEKSGVRHQISKTLSNYNLNVLEIFERIACEFPSVKIVEESK